MPEVLEQPRLLHPALLALPPLSGIAIMTISRILKAPPDQPNLPTVINNVLVCLRAVSARAPHVAWPLDHLMGELAEAALSLADACEFDQPAAMVGRVGRHRAWTLNASNLGQAPLSLREAIGYEFARAYLTQDTFSVKVASDLLSLVETSCHDGLSQKELDWIENYVLSQANRTRHVFADRSAGLDADTTVFNARVTASLTARTSSLRGEECRAAGRINEMTEMELRTTTPGLRKMAEAGDAKAVQAALAFCIGLPWELSLEVPFFSGSCCPSVIWIDPATGCVCCDLERVLPGLSKQHKEQHIKTSLVLVRPLPMFLAELVHAACAARPGLEAGRALAAGDARSSRSVLPGSNSYASIRPSLARLIASSAGIGLRSGLPRDLAAYSSLSLTTLSKSDHPYVNKERTEIWQGSNQIYDSIGWGLCVPDIQSDGVGFGSRVTPELTWVKVVVSERYTCAMDLRPGKRYAVKALIQHHNAFAMYVGLLMIILTGSLHRKKVEFCASSWQENRIVGQHSDKLVGPTRGLTPLPIPATLSVQLRYWLVHVVMLDRRLAKRGFADDHPSRATIRAIVNGEKTSLLFSPDTQGLPLDLLTGEIFVGAASNMNRDFGRHLIPGLLVKQGIHFEWVQCWLRHHVASTSAASMNTTTVQQVWLSRVAAGLDRIALDIGLRPTHGIAKKVKDHV